jgi:hypothetical protein
MKVFSSEEEIQIFWESASGLKIYDGEREIYVAFSGLKSRIGPDFKNAVVFVDGVKIEGDVECHLKASDWFEHRHHQNPEFSSVRIHVVGEEDVKLPGFVISLDRISNLNEDKKFFCAELSENIKRQEILRFAQIRLLRKAQRQKERIKEVGDEQALWEFISEALGYERYKNFMLNFARKYPLELVKRMDKGSFDKISDDELKKIKIHPGRPQNHPKFRLNILYEISKIDFLSLVRELFEKKSDFKAWKNSFSFPGLGEGRLKTIIVNVFIPYLLNCYEKDEVLNCFSSFPPEEENRIIRYAKKSLNLRNLNMIEAQGLIEIFLVKCSKFLCYACRCFVGDKL